MRTRFTCPRCRWDFAQRKKNCCPGCGARLVLSSDLTADHPERDFFYHERRAGWVYVDDWQKHLKAQFQKFVDHNERERAEAEGRAASFRSTRLQ